MSRALGDLQYKDPLNNTAPSPLSLGQRKASFKPNEEQGDLVSAEPFLSRVRFLENRLYILALTTDGVTNAMADGTIIDKIAGYYRSGTNAEEISKRIVDEASRVPASDNATCITVILEGRRS